MARTFIRQDTQIKNSSGSYASNVTPSFSNYEDNVTNLAEDLNNIRSQIQNVINRDGAVFPTGDWYDDISNPVTSLETGSPRGINKLNTELHNLERKRVLTQLASLVDVYVSGSQNWSVLAYSELPTPSITSPYAVAVGISSVVTGTVAASGSIGSWSKEIVSGSSAINPKNLFAIVSGSNRDPILSDGRAIYALFQTDKTDGQLLVGGDAQLSFVRVTSTGNDLEAVPAADVENKIINYISVTRKALEDISEQDFLRGAEIDFPAATAGSTTAGNSYFTSPSNDFINATGSLALAGGLGGNYTASSVGADVFLFVSGSSGSIGTSTRGVAAFGGDVKISGSLVIGTGSIKITSNNIQFGSANNRIENVGNELRFYDSVNPAGVTLATIATPTKDFFDSTTDGSIYTTGSFAFRGQESIDSPLDKGSDVFFYVSGSNNGTNRSLFGGDLVVSGNITTSGDIKASSNTPRGIFTDVVDVTIGGAASTVTIAGDLKVSGNDIKSATGATAITLDGTNVVIPGDLTVNGSTVTVNTTNLEIKDAVVGLGFASGTIAQTAGDRGLIVGLSGADNAAILWKNSSGEFALGRTTSSATGSLPVPISSYSNIHVANVQASIVTASLGFSGSLTRLSDGSSYLVAGPNITITSSSNGAVTITSTASGGSGSGDPDATYLVLSATGSLNNERVFTAGDGINFDDAGAGGNYTVSISDSVVATVSGSTFTGIVTFNEGLSGSLTQLADGTSYLVAGNNITIVSSSNGPVTISATLGGLAGGALTGSYPNPEIVNRPVLVFQPGGSSTSDNVFTTWTDLMTAFNGSTGQVIIEVDTTFGSATVSSGTHDLQERAIIQGAGTSVAFPPALTLPDGAILKNPKQFYQIELVCQGTTSPNCIITTDNIFIFKLGYLTLNGTQPFVRLSGSENIIFIFDEYQVINNTVSAPAIDINSASATASVFAYRGAYIGNDNFISGVASSTLYMFFDAGVTVGPSYEARFPTNPNFSGSSSASSLDNSALVSYNDSLVAVNAYGYSNVQDVLDELKRRQFFFSTSANALYTTSSVAIKGTEAGIDSPADKGTDVFFYVSGSKSGNEKSLFGGNVIASGTISTLSGFTGSLTKLIDGTSFIAAGSNVTVSSGTTGQIVISAAQPPVYWQSISSGVVFTTGSVEVTGSLSVNGSSNFYGRISQGTVSTTGIVAHAQGLLTTGSGDYSHAEGRNTTASASGSHAEGFFTRATNSSAHAEGSYTLALGESSHAEGYFTTGSGLASHAEGFLTIASGSYSHAGGIGTVASGSGQTVIGSYNTQGNSTSLFVVGDGSNDTNRSDVLRVNQQRVEVTGSLLSTLGLSGSLTRLTDGSSYIAGGSGILVASSSNGSISVTASDSVLATISGSTFTGAVKFNGGLSGSLTNLVDGSKYIVAGPNITVLTSSTGQISISASLTGDGSNGNLLTANGTGGITSQGSLNYDGVTLQIGSSATISGDLTTNGSMVSINSTHLDIKDAMIGIGFASGSVDQTAGDRGWIGGLASLDNVLFKWDNSASEFALARTVASSTASLPIPIASYADLHVRNIQASVVTASLGFSGSLTRLSDGSPYVVAGTNISIASASNGSITVAAPNLALSSSPFVTIGNDSNLTSERALTAGTGLTLTDGGANSSVTLAINDSIVATVSGTTFTGDTKHNAGLSGSLTRLTDGTSYVRSGEYISVVSSSNGAITISGTGIAPLGSAYVTIGNDSTLTNERSLTAGTGLSLSDGGSNSTVTLAINNSIVATVSGTTFTGVTKHNSGLSGSLTQLVDGTSYLLAGTGISISSQSNGSVTITSTAVTSPAGSDTQVQFNDGNVFGASSLLTFNKTTGALTSSILVAPIMSASSVVSSSKSYSQVVEVVDYLKVNPGINFANIPIGTTESAYLYVSGTSGQDKKIHFSRYNQTENAVSTTDISQYDGQLQTGLVWGGFLSTQPGTTTFSITSGSGLVVRYNTSPNNEPQPYVKDVNWGGIVSASLTYVTSSQFTYIAIDENSNVLQQITPFSLAGSGDVIFLGRINHAVNVTNNAIMLPETTYGQVSSFVDFARAFGPLKVSGHTLTPSGSSLRIKKSGGDSFIVGGHYLYNQDRPNYISSTEDPDKDAPIFIYSWSSGSSAFALTNAGVGYDVLDPNRYNSSGSLTTVPADKFTNLRVFYQPLNPQGYLSVHFGTAYYDTLTDAAGSIDTETFDEGSASKLSSILCGYISVQSGTTDLSDTAKAKFLQAGLFRSSAGVSAGSAGGGGGTTTPGGLDTYVQFNQGGSTFAGDAQFTFNSTTNVLTVGNAMIGGTGQLMGSSTTFDLLDSTVQTINFGGAATTIDVGSTGGTNTLFGATKAPQGLSGSLTQLTDGSSYLISADSITITSASNGAITIGSTALSSVDHRKVRQLIHLAEEGGPFEGFTLGSYREALPSGDPFPTSVIWWEDSSKTKKIVEETITYNSQKLVTTDQWKVYDTDGTTVLATATDSINYSGVIEINRTRTIT